MVVKVVLSSRDEAQPLKTGFVCIRAGKCFVFVLYSYCSLTYCFVLISTTVFTF